MLPEKLHGLYFEQVRDIQDAAPSCGTFFLKINDCLLKGQYYKALKEARHLIEHETELMANV